MPTIENYSFNNSGENMYGSCPPPDMGISIDLSPYKPGYVCRRTGVLFFLGGGGGGGAEVPCPNTFSSACPKIKWFCPNITCPFAWKWPLEFFFFFFWGGGGEALTPLNPPPPPHTHTHTYTHTHTRLVHMQTSHNEEIWKSWIPVQWIFQAMQFLIISCKFDDLKFKTVSFGAKVKESCFALKCNYFQCCKRLVFVIKNF